MEFCGFCLITENVPRLVEFYTVIFGTEASGDAVHADLCCGGMHLAIFARDGMEQMAPGSMRNAGYGCGIMSFRVDDVDAEYARLKTLDVEFVKLPTTHPWGSRSLWFRDPDGNIINFLCQVS